MEASLEMLKFELELQKGQWLGYGFGLRRGAMLRRAAAGRKERKLGVFWGFLRD